MQPEPGASGGPAPAAEAMQERFQQDLEGLEVRTMRPTDSTQALALRNRYFPPIDADHWKQSQTAIVATLGGDIVGVVPFTIREFQIAPGIQIRAAFANSVAVSEAHRDRGIGTLMMARAHRSLARLADAMMVYTEGERGGPQYRFYRRTGHHDLYYPRELRRGSTGTNGMPSSASVSPAGSISELEHHLLRVYEDCYPGHGGSPVRGPGYWSAALASHIFVELPYDRRQIVTIAVGDRVSAYAIIGLREGELVILEAAAEPPSDPGQLWQAIEYMRSEWGAATCVIYGQDLHTPLWGSLIRSGFVQQPRDEVLVGQVLSLQGLYELRWRVGSNGPRPTIEIWTPERDVFLQGKSDGEPLLALEMKEELLHRLLLARADIITAVNEQYVTVRRGDLSDLEEVGSVLRAVPWIYHHLDYI